MTDRPSPLYVDFHLLDRQIVDRDGGLVGNVDDIELTDSAGGPVVTALLVGQLAVGERLGGRIGGWLVALARRLAPTANPMPLRIPYDLVARVGSEVTLSVSRDQLAEPALETWLRVHLIDRIPGADHESE